jgi:hypothetical protein
LDTKPERINLTRSQEYFRSVISRFIELLSPSAKSFPAYIRATLFALSRMITAEGNPRHHALVSSILFSLLHNPLLLVTPDTPFEDITTLSPVEAIQIIQTFLTNTDPAPTLVSTILSPIATSLYALLSTLQRVKTADPTLRESVRGLLFSWGRVVSAEEAIAILWACVDGQGGDWTVDLAGNVSRVEKCVCPLLFNPEFLFGIKAG